MDIMRETNRRFLCCRSVGRNPDRPTCRIVGIPTEQRLEVKIGGLTNTITSVAKDNYVIEIKQKKDAWKAIPPRK